MVSTESELNPICPKCGASMVMRTARRGSRSGQQFWGCSKWQPRNQGCDGTININESPSPIPDNNGPIEENNIKSDEEKFWKKIPIKWADRITRNDWISDYYITNFIKSIIFEYCKTHSLH